MLAYRDTFNIRSIAAALIYEAKNAGLISTASEAKNLTQAQWKKAVAKYNGNLIFNSEYFIFELQCLT